MDALEFLLDFYNSMQFLTLTWKHRFIQDQLCTDCLSMLCATIFSLKTECARTVASPWCARACLNLKVRFLLNAIPDESQILTSCYSQ